MFPPAADLHLPLPANDIAVVAFIACIAFIAYNVWLTIREAPRDDTIWRKESRPCRYGCLGRAYLVEEKTQYEGREFVEVKCFVCRRCGLPQWAVNRTRLAERVR